MRKIGKIKNKIEYKWGNRYGSGSLNRTIIKRNKCKKTSEKIAQKIRDYLNSKEWKKLAKESSRRG